MVLLRYPPFVVAVVALAACGGRSLGQGPGNHNADAGGGLDARTDAALLPDAAMTCTSGRSLRLERQALSALYLLTGENQVEGLTVRLAASMILPACRTLAQVTVTVDAQACTVELAGWAWQEIGSQLTCINDEPFTDEEIIALVGLRACDWTVLESPMGTTGQALTFRMGPCPTDQDCFCAGEPYQGRADYEDCNRECECASGQCLVGYSFIGEVRVCGRSCSVNADCDPWETCLFAADGPYGQCYREGTTPPCTELTCPPGYACSEGPYGGACLPVYEIWRTGATCSCDEVCGFGLRCVDLGYGESAFCGLPCRGQADCPGGSICGEEYAPVEPPICLPMMDLYDASP